MSKQKAKIIGFRPDRMESSIRRWQKHRPGVSKTWLMREALRFYFANGPMPWDNGNGGAR